MKECSKEKLQSWINQLSKMIPGIKQAYFISTLDDDSECCSKWPEQVEPSKDLISIAQMALSNNKTISTASTLASNNDPVGEMILAIPLKVSHLSRAAIAVQIHIRSSQQAVVMQILKWSEEWLDILLQSSQLKKKEDSPQKQLSPRFGSITGRWVMAVLILILTGLALINGQYRVSASASLEGRVQRAIVSPFDGYITRAFYRAGENVKQGDVVAELDRRELQLDKQRFQAELEEHRRQYRHSLGERDHAQAQIFKSRMNQAQAQLDLLEKKINRSWLVSPIDGVILSGDLSRSLNSPVQNGDILFEVAPLGEYRLVILVDEREVVDVRPGQGGELRLKALPGQKIAFTVNKVSPVFEEEAAGIVYRVEAGLRDKISTLRPGMQGTAKIEINDRSYLWIYFHKLYDASRLLVWSWLP